MDAIERADVVAAARRRRAPAWYDEACDRHLMGRAFELAGPGRRVKGIDDMQCGFKVFRRECCESHLFGQQYITGGDLMSSLPSPAHKFGYRIEEIPIDWYFDADSRVRPGVDTLNMVTEVFMIGCVTCSAVTSRTPQRGRHGRRTRLTNGPLECSTLGWAALPVSSSARTDCLTNLPCTSATSLAVHTALDRNRKCARSSSRSRTTSPARTSSRSCWPGIPLDGAGAPRTCSAKNISPRYWRGSPGARAGLPSTRSGALGAIATMAPRAAGRTRGPCWTFAGKACVVQRSASWLVPLVERASWRTRRNEPPATHPSGAVSDQGVDTLILGGTHFPSGRLFSGIGPDVAILEDSAETTAR